MPGFCGAIGCGGVKPPSATSTPHGVEGRAAVGCFGDIG